MEKSYLDEVIRGSNLHDVVKDINDFLISEIKQIKVPENAVIYRPKPLTGESEYSAKQMLDWVVKKMEKQKNFILNENPDWQEILGNMVDFLETSIVNSVSISIFTDIIRSLVESAKNGEEIVGKFTAYEGEEGFQLPTISYDNKKKIWRRYHTFLEQASQGTGIFLEEGLLGLTFSNVPTPDVETTWGGKRVAIELKHSLDTNKDKLTTGMVTIEYAKEGPATPKFDQIITLFKLAKKMENLLYFRTSIGEAEPSGRVVEEGWDQANVDKTTKIIEEKDKVFPKDQENPYGEKERQIEEIWQAEKEAGGIKGSKREHTITELTLYVELLLYKLWKAINGELAGKINSAIEVSKNVKPNPYAGKDVNITYNVKFDVEKVKDAYKWAELYLFNISLLNDVKNNTTLGRNIFWNIRNNPRFSAVKKELNYN